MPYRGSDASELDFVGTGSTSFDGGDYITYGTTGMPTSGEMSFAMLVKPTDITASYIFISYDNTIKYAFGFYGGNFLVGTTGTRSIIATTSNHFGNNTWTHVAINYLSSSSFEIYIDGAPVAITGTGSYYGATNNMIGATNASSPAYLFNGSLKNVAIWNRALTATEVKNVMYKTYAEVGGRLASGLVSWWSLELSSLYTDSTGNNDGTNSGSTQSGYDTLYGGNTPIIPRAIDNAPTVQADAIGAGSALFVDSNTDYISCGNDSSLQLGTADFTISAWIYRTSSGHTAIMGYGDDASSEENWRFRVKNTNPDTLEFLADDGSTSVTVLGSATITENEWHHVAFSWDRDSATGAQFYLNGSADGSGQDMRTVGDLDHSSDGLFIGVRPSSSAPSGNPWDGYICQVGVWDAALTQAQIQSIMEKTYGELTASEKTDLVSWYPLDAATNLAAGSSNVKDSHGSNHGTLA